MDTPDATRPGACHSAFDVQESVCLQPAWDRMVLREDRRGHKCTPQSPYTRTAARAHLPTCRGIRPGTKCPAGLASAVALPPRPT